MRDHSTTTEIRRSPTLAHAIGNGRGGRVRIHTPTQPFGYVSCEHPQEFLDAIPGCPSGNWIRCDDGSIVQLRHVVKIDVPDEGATRDA